MNFAEPIAGNAKSGISGLDDILSGGFSREHVFLVEGAPGTGKTTVALQFLLEGARAGEKGLYITLSETERELRAGAASHAGESGEFDHAAMRLARYSSSQPAVLRRRRMESLPGALRVRL